MLVYFHGGGLVMGSNHSFEPLAQGDCRRLQRDCGVRSSTGWRPEHRRPHSSTTPMPRPRGSPENAERLGVDPIDSRWSATAPEARWPPGWRWPLATAAGRRSVARCCSIRPRSRHGRTVDHSACRRADALAVDDIDYMHDLADSGAGAPHDHYRVPAYAADLSGLPPAIVADRRMRPDSRLGRALRRPAVATPACRRPLTRYPGMYHGFLMRSDATARGQAGDRRDRRPACGRSSPTRCRFNRPGHRTGAHCTGRFDDRINVSREEETIDAHRRAADGAFRRAAARCAASGGRQRLHRGSTASDCSTWPHDNGPWKLIIAQHFASADELMATMSGAFPEGFTPTLDLFLTPTFRGYLANYGTVLYPELHDCFYNARIRGNGKELLECRVRQAVDDAVQHQRTLRESRSGTPGFA